MLRRAYILVCSYRVSVRGLWFRVGCVSGFRFWFSGLSFRVRGLGCWAGGLGFSFRVSALGGLGVRS